jgi:hypothetical protein
MSEEPAAMEFSSDATALPPGASASGRGVRQVTRRSRVERAEQLEVAEARLAAGEPLRQVAAALGVPRSTLRSWRKALPLAGEALPSEVASALATPAGMRWRCRLVVALHLIITLRAAGGIRMVCECLELSGLAGVLGTSYGSQRAVNVAVQEALAEAAQAQHDALAAGMAPREVALCVDETFDPDVCLVAIEPVSNDIVAEAYAPNRTAATWRQCLEQALTGLPVTVIQGISDEAGALRHLIEKDFGAAHGSDLMHAQHEVAKGTGLHLARQLKQADAVVAAAQAHVDAQRAAQHAYEAQSRHPRGRPPAFAARIAAALTDLVAAEAEQTQAQARQAEARELIRELGTIYHPYEVETGQVQSVARVAARFEQVWTRLSRLVAAADLPTRARERIAKAQRLTVHWLAYLSFFFATLQARVEALDLPADLEQAFLTQLVPALYLERVAARSTQAETRHRLAALSAQLLEPLRQPTHPLQALPLATRQHLEAVARGCADLFQRSSSCVEGRNGQLSLYHHGCHRLRGRKLPALTAIHNYHIRRPDRTTAAERLFGRSHPPLFELVLARVSRLPPPRRRRPRAPKLAALALAAA